MNRDTKADFFWMLLFSSFVLGVWTAATYSGLRWRNEPIQVEIIVVPEPYTMEQFMKQEDVIQQGVFPLHKEVWISHDVGDCSGQIYTIQPQTRPYGHVGLMRNIDELENLIAKARQIDRQGKRSEPGVLSPETIRSNEIKEYFLSPGRDPMEKVK